MPDILQTSPLEIVLIMLFTFLAFFIATFIVILFMRGLGQRKRGAAPSLTVNAAVTGKRKAAPERDGKASAAYYVAFRTDGGEQMELAVDAATYGLLAPGDGGQLTLQGTQYLGFVRD